MRKMNCCYNCPKRKTHCHATCEEYKQFSEENAKERKIRNKQKSAEYGYAEYVFNSRDKIQRAHGRRNKPKGR